MINRILVPLDGSKRAEAILSHVESIAKSNNAKVFFLKVEEEPIMLERDEVIDFTQAYTPPDPSIYLAADAGVDVESAVIAAQSSTIQAAFIAEKGWQLVEFATPEETVAAVRNGEADAVLADGDYLLPIVSESGGELEVVGEVPLGGGVGKILRFGKLPVNFQTQAFYNVEKPDGAATWSIQFEVKFLFPEKMVLPT